MNKDTLNTIEKVLNKAESPLAVKYEGISLQEWTDYVLSASSPSERAEIGEKMRYVLGKEARNIENAVNRRLNAEKQEAEYRKLLKCQGAAKKIAKILEDEEISFAELGLVAEEVKHCIKVSFK